MAIEGCRFASPARARVQDLDHLCALGCGFEGHLGQRFGPRRIGVAPVERDEVEEVDAAPALSLVVRLRPVRDYRPQVTAIVLNAKRERVRGEALRALAKLFEHRRQGDLRKLGGEHGRVLGGKLLGRRRRGRARLRPGFVRSGLGRGCGRGCGGRWRLSGFYRRARRWSRLRRAARHGHEARAGEQERGGNAASQCHGWHARKGVGRGARIRTGDLAAPNRALYQAELHPVQPAYRRTIARPRRVGVVHTR